MCSKSHGKIKTRIFDESIRGFNMDDKFYATANRFAEIEGRLIKGQKYIVTKCLYGLVDVHNLDGKYLKQTRTDHFDNWTRVEM